MNIDFLYWTDPWCGYNPKVLACDGTHVGMSLRLIDFTPIDKPADDAPLREPLHKRYDRVFMPYIQGIDNAKVRNSRAALLQFVKSTLSETDNSAALDENVKTDVLSCLPVDDKVKVVVAKFMSHSYSAPVHQAFATVLKLLLCDAPVSSVLPYRFLTKTECGLHLLTSDSANQASKDEEVTLISSYAPEISCLLRAGLSDGVLVEISSFVSHLINFVRTVHSSDIAGVSPHSLPSSSPYNPETGIAYYFTPSGDSVRSLPLYKVVGESSSTTCSKIYPQVSHGGYSYTFFWFCPIHGHCYGFHAINGPEGRKDPFASLYKYMPVAPEEIFYDFACSLSEYCLNREPEFFRGTRFWHDIFHRFSHKCSKSFCSSRIMSLHHINSEICEQFNSYLQCIKYTASHLQQSHFTFFLQFFIYQWNVQKTLVCLQHAATAINGFN
jgi:hypothetical protein